MTFKKRSPLNPVNLSTGRGIRFQDVGGDMGFYTTEDPAIIAEFQAAMAAGRGGVQLSSPEEFAEAEKKKIPSLNSQLNSTVIKELQTAGKISPGLIPAFPPALVAVDPVVEVAKVEPAVPVAAPVPKVVKRK